VHSCTENPSQRLAVQRLARKDSQGDHERSRLDATIRALRADESRLTQAPALVPRHFWPVLVTTEGFPIHPIITARVRRMLREAVSDLSTFGFREWLLVTHGPLRPPARIMQRWDRGLVPILTALERSEALRTATPGGEKRPAEPDHLG